MARLRRAILPAVALFLCAAQASAGRPDILAPSEHLPADVELVLVVDGAAEHLRSESGPALRALADVLLAGDETAAAWARLAARLGMSEEQAFDALLGQRVVLVGRGVWSDAPAWALLAEVDHRTAQTLIKRLPNAPRGIVAGRAISAVEDGKFELTVERRKHGATVLVAPAKSASLFDELAPLLARAPAKPLRRSAPMLEMGAALKADLEQRADVMLYLRLPPDTGGWAATLARRSGREIVARFAARPDRAIGEVDAWSLKPWAAMSEGALLCVMERRPRPVDGGGALPPTLIADLPWIAPAPGGGAEAALGERHALALHRGKNGGLVATIAVETVGGAAAAVEGDAMMRSFAVRLSQRLHQGAWDYDFAGAFPEALRVVKLTQVGGPRLPYIRSEGLTAGSRDPEGAGRWPAPEAPDEAFGIAWTYRFEPRCQQGSGWLTVGTSPGRVAKVADGLVCEGTKAVEGAWLSVGQAEPANLLGALRSSGDPLPAPADALGWVEFLGWRVELADAGAVRGAVKLRFADGR